MKERATYFIIILLFNSCFHVHHKIEILSINQRGDLTNKMKLNGYYYRELEKKTSPYFENQYGRTSQKKTESYQQKLIEPLILNLNGTVRTFPLQSGLQENLVFNFRQHCDLLDDNTTKSALEHFECMLHNDTDRFDVWGKGVFKADDSSILIQYYINWIGEYYLQEQKGKILTDTSFVLTERYDYKLDTTFQINELYYFREFKNKPDSTNYITKHPKRFGNKKKHHNK